MSRVWQPYPAELKLIASNVADGTRPATTNGTSVTPSQNSLAQGYTELIAAGSITSDIYEIELIFYNWDVTTVARDAIAQIGLGGVDWFGPLIMGMASSILGQGYISYRFPLYGKSGNAVSCKVSVNSTDLTAGQVICKLYGLPTGPIRVGSFLRTFGVDTANSRGTIITPGTTSEGAWTQLGSALTEPLWFWDFGAGLNDATMTSAGLYVDIGLGDATNKRVIINDAIVVMSSAEQLRRSTSGRIAVGAVGDLVYARGQYSAALDTDFSIAAYAVGG